MTRTPASRAIFTSQQVLTSLHGAALLISVRRRFTGHILCAGPLHEDTVSRCLRDISASVQGLATEMHMLRERCAHTRSCQRSYSATSCCAIS